MSQWLLSTKGRFLRSRRVAKVCVSKKVGTCAFASKLSRRFRSIGRGETSR